MNVLIIEDESLTAKRLESLLQKYDPSINVLAKLPSVAEAVEWFNESHPPIELVFMDIHLEDDLGFRIFEQTSLSTPVIFTTAYDEYMIQAFKVNSIDYLLKPINYDELVAAIEKFKALKKQFGQASSAPDIETLLNLIGRSRQTDYKDRFMITVGTKIRSIETSEIAYFFLEEKVVFLVTKDGLNLPVDYSLDKLTQLLNPRQFFRISRQFLVSLPAIQTIHTFSAGKLKLDLQPKSRQEVFVSGDRMTEFKEWLGK
ncbi:MULTISPECIES: LytTR family DNA-binding domain-containing protein [unclassified Spirosoma]|uniref:LytR/AlgR family response regulator transcription factor n=1 Tax=unclassified Spirosoma TaxID=2621999 RepID=UPI0009634BD8|nr:MULTISPECIES: LytTR family DNA-binding domain-containing protein [unclassified Spirosoma]MBN8820935.1 response regulator transcription factor [Spirosoma sp.]OJW75946.1 MAG: DNA-binding response regulator [Spirosoma sp. 48-14]